MSYTRANGYIEDTKSGEADVVAGFANLIGFTLRDVLKIVQEKGYSVENISITAPPRLEISEYDDSFRVLRVQPLEGNRLTILVCKPL